MERSADTETVTDSKFIDLIISRVMGFKMHIF